MFNAIFHWIPDPVKCDRADGGFSFHTTAETATPIEYDVKLALNVLEQRFGVADWLFIIS